MHKCCSICVKGDTVGVVPLQIRCVDGLLGNELAGSEELGTPGNTDHNVIAISAASVSEFSLSVCIFDYTTGTFGGSGDTAARNAYIDGLNTENCGISPSSSTSAGFP